jgi:hypothetical protein
LRKWADWQYTQPSNWNGADTSVLQVTHGRRLESSFFQMHLLQTLLPGAKAGIKSCDATWRNASDDDTYMAFVTCVKVTLGKCHAIRRLDLLCSL